MANGSSLAGRVALVTGGSGGLGSAMCVALATAGAAVAINYRQAQAGARAVQSRIESAGGKAISVQADVAKSNEVDAMVSAIEAGLGPIDILINNAGIGSRLAFEDTTEAIWDEYMEVNLKSAFLCTQAVVPGMQARRWGRIVNISSIAAQTGGSAVGAGYAASKAGLLGLTHYCASMWAKDGITVNATASALVETEMVIALDVPPSAVPVGRFGRPEEHADAVLMLVNNGYITGQTLNVNGGLLTS
ncbi:MAG: 3-oxoacyl-[acyl-carrier protein] reductase [Gammaproteobacteria bacterium]|jgi:3-oxoacyl-[acyl-carrier protein] reductase